MTDLGEAGKLSTYTVVNKVRFITGASLFDGHDASINIMRRILMANGAEVIHLGHNCSVDDIVTAALQEDAQGIAISSYQGGHVEYFKYMIDLLRERGGAHIKVFGDGRVIVPSEIADLHAYGVSRVFSPEDGQRLGLVGMILSMIKECDTDLSSHAPASIAALTIGSMVERQRPRGRKMDTRRSEPRKLKRAVNRQGSVEAMLALLQRSVKLGYKKLASLRCLQAEQVGIQIQPVLLAYCHAVAGHMPRAELERIAARIQRGGSP